MVRRIAAVILSLILLFSLSSCGRQTNGIIYLYSEATHGDEQVLEEALAIWQTLYHEQRMRHLFCEVAYYHAAYLNMWMQEPDDAILDQLFEDWIGTAAHTDAQYQYYKSIKETCPETIFHGTDLGHQYQTSGQRYLRYLEEQGLADSEEYLLTLEAIEQGRFFYENKRMNTDSYRETVMTDNFIREYDRLKNESIFGTYGSIHADIEGLNYSREIPSMAHQLHDRYGDKVMTIRLSDILATANSNG